MSSLRIQTSARLAVTRFVFRVTSWVDYLCLGLTLLLKVVRIKYRIMCSPSSVERRRLWHCVDVGSSPGLAPSWLHHVG